MKIISYESLNFEFSSILYFYYILASVNVSQFHTTGYTWRKRQIATGGDLTLSGGKFCGGELTVNRSARYKHNPHLRI